MSAQLHRVLVVHRDAEMRIMLRTVLGQAGIETVEASNFDEALEVSAGCDLVIVSWDEAMSGSDLTDGVERLHLIQRSKPLLILCGDIQKTGWALAPQLKDCELLQEPFGVDSFLAQVRRLLPA